MKHLITFLLALTVLSCSKDSAPINRASVAGLTADDIQYHVNYLASDQLEGRLSGTPGGDLAANYIAAEFKRFNLQPLGEPASYFQKFDFIGDMELGPQNHLRLTNANGDTTWKLGVDFIPAGFSGTGNLELDSDVAFAGYGISATEKGYDDYANLEVSGKAVLIMRYSPGLNDPHSGFAKFEGMRFKATTAREHGAAALLVATDRKSVV